jgi:glycosyltransferase involved in cell wall biosynthesis
MNPRLSIIIPAYNQAEYLEDCLDSAYNQTVQAHEIIVINDGSGDNTQEIAERYMFKEFPMIESPVRVISQVNKGLASARNTGIMASTGDYVLPLDSDDMLMENAVEKITNEILNTGADIIAPSFKEFGKSDREVILGGFNMDDLKVANRLAYCCAVRRSALVEVGGYNPKMKWGWEDYDIWFDLLKRGKSVAILQDILFKYRVKERSMIHEANEHADELWSQIKKNHPSLF